MQLFGEIPEHSALDSLPPAEFEADWYAPLWPNRKDTCYNDIKPDPSPSSCSGEMGGAKKVPHAHQLKQVAAWPAPD